MCHVVFCSYLLIAANSYPFINTGYLKKRLWFASVPQIALLGSSLIPGSVKWVSKCNCFEAFSIAAHAALHNWPSLYFPVTHSWPRTHNIHQVNITSWRSWPAHSNRHTSGSVCSNPVLHTYPSLPLLLKQKVINFIMFPLVQACGLRYKVILCDGRKQSQKMEMHCIVSSATSGYLFGQICIFFLHGNPPPSITLAFPELMSKGAGGTSLQCHVACWGYREGSLPFPLTLLLLLQTKKFMWGIQLVNLTLHTLLLVRNTDTPFLHRASHNKLSERRARQRKSELLWVRLLIISLKQTGRHLASITARDGMQGSSAAAVEATRCTDTCYAACNYCIWDWWYTICSRNRFIMDFPLLNQLSCHFLCQTGVLLNLVFVIMISICRVALQVIFKMFKKRHHKT